MFISRRARLLMKAPHNNSDRSGGSVFRIKLLPVIEFRGSWGQRERFPASGCASYVVLRAKWKTMGVSLPSARHVQVSLM
jgi:hypothetical protein